MDNFAIVTSSNSIDVFRISAAGALRTAGFDDKLGCSGWSVLSEAIFPANQQVCAAANGAGEVHAFAVDKTGVIQHVARQSATAAWQGPVAMSGIKAGEASLAAAWPMATPLSIFCRNGGGTNVGAVMRATLEGPNAWTPWIPVGEPALTATYDIGSLCAIVQPGGETHLLANSNAGPQHTVLTGEASSVATVWTTVVGIVNGRPSAVSRSTTSFDVVALDPFMIATSDTAIAGGSWQGWQYSDQEADSQPAKGMALDASTVVVVGYGEVEAGSGVIVSRVSIDSGGEALWGAWQLIPGDLSWWDGTQLCVVLRSGRFLHIFVNHGDGMVSVMCDTALDHWSWSAWAEIKAPEAPHWQLANKLPPLTRTPPLLHRVTSWISLALGLKS